MIPAWKKFVNDESLSLNRRWLYTALLLFAFRLLAHIPVANIDEKKLHRMLADNPLVGIVDLFAGGEVLGKFSLVAAGILPFLVARTLANGAIRILPQFRELRLQGERGKKRINLATTLLSIPCAFLFAWLLSHYLTERTGLFPGHIHWFTRASFGSTLWIVCWVTAGSLLSTGIAYLITKKGIGSGEDVILLAGSGFGFVQQLVKVTGDAPQRIIGIEHLALALICACLVIVYSVYLLQSVRRIPLQYPRSPTSSARNRPSSGLPLLLDDGRILPVTAAVGCLVLLQLIDEFLASNFPKLAPHRAAMALNALVNENGGWHWMALACLILLFTGVLNFSRLWQPFSGSELPMAEWLKRNLAFIPGVRPGQRTQEYLSRKVSLITIPGAVGLAVLGAGFPYLILRLTKQNVIVSLLALMVVVETVDTLQDSVKAYRTRESYKGFLTR